MSDKHNNEVDELVDALEEDEAQGQSRQAAVANVLPLHAVHAPKKTKAPSHPVGKRKRGRPKKVKEPPTADELAYHAEMQRRLEEFVSSDPLVQTTVARKNSPEKLQAMQEKIAKLAATLDFMRIEDGKYGKYDGTLVSRQVQAIKQVAEIELRIRELGQHSLDLRSEAVQQLFALFVSKIQQVAKTVLNEKDFDLFFNRLEVELQGWEDEAENLLR